MANQILDKVAVIRETKLIDVRHIDEDISVEGLIAGRPSGESQSSFKKWLEAHP